MKMLRGGDFSGQTAVALSFRVTRIIFFVFFFFSFIGLQALNFETDLAYCRSFVAFIDPCLNDYSLEYPIGLYTRLSSAIAEG